MKKRRNIKREKVRGLKAFGLKKDLVAGEGWSGDKRVYLDEKSRSDQRTLEINKGWIKN